LTEPRATFLLLGDGVVLGEEPRVVGPPSRCSASPSSTTCCGGAVAAREAAAVVEAAVAAGWSCGIGGGRRRLVLLRELLEQRLGIDRRDLLDLLLVAIASAVAGIMLCGG